MVLIWSRYAYHPMDSTLSHGWSLNEYRITEEEIQEIFDDIEEYLNPSEDNDDEYEIPPGLELFALPTEHIDYYYYMTCDEEYYKSAP